MPVKAIPEGCHSITPYLIVPGVDRLVAFLKQVFDAEERERHLRPDGTIMHAEVKIGDSLVMMGEPMGQWAPRTGTLYLYVNDVDEVYRRALEAGGTSLMEVADQFYGDRSGGITDPAGNFWFVATHVEDVSADEMARRIQEMEHKAA